MIRTRDEEINNILDRAEKYRKGLQKSSAKKVQINPNIKEDIEKIFKIINDMERKLINQQKQKQGRKIKNRHNKRRKIKSRQNKGRKK